jgi:quercetin dioxygenase-like cupin family protein
MVMKRIAFAALAVASVGTTALVSQSRAMDMVPDASSIKWEAAPPSLPKGAQIAVLAGDPSKDGPYVLRLKLPDRYVVPAHHHPTAENVTVVSGTFYAGMGDKVDQAKAAAFKPGGFASLPANMNHFAWASGETVVQVHGNGPFAIVYANPADDPAKAQ